MPAMGSIADAKEKVKLFFVTTCAALHAGEATMKPRKQPCPETELY